jgi:hypothetical protein
VVSVPTGVQPAPDAAERRSRRATILAQLRFLVLPAAAVALWAWSLPGIDPRVMNDLGLISVLPWPTWLAFGLLTVGFIVCWRHAGQTTWLLLVHVLLLIVMLYGLPGLVTHEPSGPIVFRHAGITENLIQTRVVNTRIDAYFAWPGFFMGLATLVKLAGAPSALSFGTWATVAFNLLYLPPLLLLARALTRDPRLIWGTVWLFYAANWINQDYLAPQAFTYIFYLTILGLLLTYIRPSRTDLLDGRGRFQPRIRALLRVREAEVPLPAPSRWTAAAVLMLVVLFYTVTVASHQLTPFAILFGVAALVAIGQCTARGLPLLMAVILTLWITFAARGYVSGHLDQLVGGLGDITQAASANVTARISGSAQHLLVVRVRLVLSGTLWLLALLGAIRRFRSGHADHAAAALCLAPLLLFGLQVYGGEMLLRMYLFMLPFVAFFATAVFLPGRWPASTSRARRPAALRASAAVVAFGLTTAVVLAACLAALYGNERVDYFTPGERAAIRFLYQDSRPGSTFAAEVSYLPWQYQDYDQHRFLAIMPMLRWQHPPSPAQALGRIARATRPGRYFLEQPAGFVILTRSQRINVETFGGLPTPGYLDTFERLLRESPRFRLIYSNSDAQIYERLPGVIHVH